MAKDANMVIRYQGGDNAGHTVFNEYGTFKLHLVPSGIFNPDTVCLIGAGCVVNPESLIDEIAELEEAGVSTKNLFISDRAHVTLYAHVLLDKIEEELSSLGTTKRGIGPTYADKVSRVGLRLADLISPAEALTKVERILTRANDRIIPRKGRMEDVEEVMEVILEWSEALRGRIVDTLPLTHRAIKTGQYVLLEGQLGAMRDLDWGTYPYVTSSNPLAGGACAGAGIPPRYITEVVGVVKCYGTSVGEGPLPGELLDEVGAKLREVGQEYGATTGRPRRCAWLDAVALKHATMLNGFTSFAITKLDVLDDFPEVKICILYEVDGIPQSGIPATLDLSRVTPVYMTFPGWMTSTKGCRTWESLPEKARDFLSAISCYGDAPIRYVSVGAERDAIIDLTEGVDSSGIK
jgi:adenylosuccinate synthase